jgi:peptide/nickel transport system substrate-binding protein
MYYSGKFRMNFAHTILLGVLLTLLFAVACGTAAPPAPAAEKKVETPVEKKAVPTTTPAPTPKPTAVKAKLRRLSIAIAPLGFDTNYSYKVTISGLLDKRPALEWLIGIDRNTGAYIPELAEAWKMSPNGKDWTLTLRKGVKWHENWGEFTAKDVRHSFYLLVQPESAASGISLWRGTFGVKKDDTAETVAKKMEEIVEIVNDHTVIIHNKQVQPEFELFLAYDRASVMESKARWDAIGHEGYGKSVVGTGPFKFVKRVEGTHVLYEAVENHYRKTPDYKELELRWVQESATRLAALLTGEVHLSDIERAVRAEAVARGMKIIPSKFPDIQHRWYFGGLYFTEPEKLDSTNPFTNKKVRQAMNKAINRQAIIKAFLSGAEVRMPALYGFDPVTDEAIWPGVFNQDWLKRWDEMYGYDPKRAKDLLAEAGYPNGFGFTLYLYTLPGLAEMVDIGQAMALDFEAIGLKPRLVNTEFAKVRDLYRSQTIGAGIWPSRGGNASSVAMLSFQTKTTTTHAFQHPEFDKKLDELDRTLDRGQRARLIREMGDIIYNEFGMIQMLALGSDIAANPKFVAEYVFPGNVTGFYTHLEYIKTVPQ